jgi:hypothetical protein
MPNVPIFLNCIVMYFQNIIINLNLQKAKNRHNSQRVNIMEQMYINLDVRIINIGM